MRALARVCGVALLLLASAAAGAEPSTVVEVRVRGTQRSEADVVLQRVKSRAGSPYDPKVVREDVRAVYGLGYYRDVTVEYDDEGRLTFVVAERSALREWRAEGAKELDKEELEKAVPLKKREILNPARVDEGARAIQDLFREKGFYLAQVASKVVPLEDGKNQVDVVYQVTEGEKVRVKDINLLGVRKADEKELRRVMATTEAGLWSWLTSSGTFKEADLERDREVVRSYYLNQGYVEVKVLDPRVSLTADRRWLKVDLPVEEGESFRLGTIVFSGDLEFPKEQLEKAAALTGGDTFRSDDFRRAIQSISDLYADVGYAFVDVDPQTRLDRGARLVDVDFHIRKGDRVRIGRIETRGNTKTRDRIVRREMRIAEGQIYSATAIRKSRQKIENLGFFEKVNLTTNRRPGTDLVDVDVEVEEKATGAFSIGAGYSSVDKIVGMANVSQRNFLGLGYQVAVNANVGSTAESYTVTFNNPRLYDSDVYGGFDFYKTNRSYTDYDKKAVGGDLKIGMSLGDDWRTRWIYRYEDADVSNISADANSVLQQQKGKTITSAVLLSLTYDTRDNPWEPHTGTLAEASVELAGSVLGGTAQYVKYEWEGSRYVPLWWRHVLTVHSQVGYIDALKSDGIPVFERYYLGGINSLRGFDSRSVGPLDSTGAVIGGDKQVLVNLEYLFPLIEEAKVRGLLFFDAGNAWDEGQPLFDTALRRSAGAGIRWFSPMGPLRLEWGRVLDRKPDESPSRWEFSIGGFF
ncbi:MAG: outer membrane protein assembly factor BamA [Deltaproteobacteria bacterium]|nr:outer membrane protein assembly factor BamA [Deltaproteobacteria bacterium]